MAGSELAFEGLALALEATRDTAITPPTNMAMMPLTTGVAAAGGVTSTTSLVGGSGYVPATQSLAFAFGVGAPAAGGRQAVIYANTSAGVITSLTITDPGSN